MKMNPLEVVGEVRRHLEQNGRISLRMLRRQYELDDESLEELIEELVDIQRVARREENALAWSAPPPSGGVQPPVSESRADAASEIAASRQTTASGEIRVAAESSEAQALEGERKTVTALFADIKGSMDLMEDLDPEEARGIVDPALRLMIDAAHRYDGYIVQSTGDGIFAIFGAPVAHEDHPQRALYAALRMQDDVKRHAEKLRAEKGLNLQVRVGVNTGEVVVRSIKTDDAHTEYTPIGHSTSLASRLQALAAPGSIAISETVRKLIEGYFALKAMGPARIKGVSEPVNVYEVTGLGPLRTRLQRSAGRGLTKFVGREREMEAMKAAAERAQGGHGQIVAAMAEAGTGKSRLFYEFKVKIQSGWMVLETFSVSHGKASAYLPVIDLLHGYFKISSEDDARARREKIGGKVLMLDRAQEDTLPYLFALLGIVEREDPLAGMDGQVRKRRTLDAIKRLLLRESLNQPLIIIFEDLHWIDDETQALLNLLADSIANAKILLLVNYRPEYSHQWNSKTYYTQLRLDPLGKESADEMLTALLGDGAEMAQLKRVITERTEGNPFFMEETVQVLLDEGALVRDGAMVKLTKPIAELKIPPTVQGILAARIDRLPADEKDLLQSLAVTGKEFPLSIVREVVRKPDDELIRMLNDLQLAEFIYEQPAVGDVEYSFKHALTQEVAYNSVLMERRRVLHGQIGAALEATNPASIDDHLAELAHHYSRSANAAKAIKYLGLASRQALARTAYAEAKAYASAGLALLKEAGSGASAPAELRLQNILGAVFQATKGFGAPETESAFERCIELAERLGDSDSLFSARSGLRVAQMFAGKPHEARRLAEQIVAQAHEDKDPAMLALAYLNLTDVLLVLGEVGPSYEAAETAIGFSDQAEKTPELIEYRAIIRALEGLALSSLGYPARAIEVIREVESLSRLSPYWQANTSRISTWTYVLVRDFQAALLAAERTLKVCEEHGFQLEHGMAAALRAIALIELGRIDEGLKQARQAVAETSDRLGIILSLSSLALAELRVGESDKALEALNRGLALIRETDSQFMTEDFLWMKGEALLAKDPSNRPQAEDCLRSAIDLARRRSAKSFELRSTLRLARLLRDTNRREEARAMLAEIYNWFTEGFDTADLKDAKALLDELGA